MDITEVITANLKALRESTGLNQTAFAKKCKLQQRAYGRIENGESLASIPMLEAIALHNDLQVWQILVPNMNASNPPVLQGASEKEKLFYESIKKAAQQIAKYDLLEGQ